MQGQSMQRIISKLRNKGVNLIKFTSLDFFAREGDWQTMAYASEVGAIEAWEIDPVFAKGLKRNIPEALVRTVDSFAYGTSCSDRFNFIVIDNPQNTFGPNDQFCEHFEALPIAAKLLTDDGFIVFNINWAPFNYEASPLWKARREEFYGLTSTELLSLDDFILPFYTSYFEHMGMTVRDAFLEPRNDQYLTNIVFQLGKDS